ncbi:MAG: VWA domain-containing protein [Bacteroidetes bacterium]|nr:VWA domain-containing protein [Bacteroidota bacterium]
MIQFETPSFLFLLLVLPVWGVWFWFRRKISKPVLTYGRISAFGKNTKTFWVWVSLLLLPARWLGLILLIIALARPQLVNTERIITSEGVDIILTLDISASMKAMDLNPNRLAAAKEVARDFVAGREADRIGMVVFAGQAFTQAPLTLDYEMIKNLIQSTTWDEANPGTAIGMALATSINRLRDSDAKSKVIILLTDGRNNQGEIDPVTAADLALSMGVKVYTIGVGRLGEAQIPVKDQFGRTVLVNQAVDVDDETLTKVAEMTGGKYYRATDNQSLRKIYAEIGTLEKTKVEMKNYYQYDEIYHWFLLPGLLLLLIEFLLSKTRCRPAVSELGEDLK